MPAELVSLAAWSASFWVALAGFLRGSRDGEGAARHVVGLALGAVAAHVGWIALHVDRVAAAGWAGWLAPAGFCVLFVPLGPLAAARGLDRDARARFLAAAFGALPLALAVARVGCWLAGCCHGVPTDAPWAVSVAGETVHPTPGYEIAALVVLQGLAARVPDRLVAPLVLAGLGAARLSVDPWRATPPLGAPVIPAAAIAAGMLFAGVAWGFWGSLAAGLPRLRTARVPRP